MVRERLRHGVPGLPLLPLVLLPLAGIPFFRAGRQAFLSRERWAGYRALCHGVRGASDSVDLPAQGLLHGGAQRGEGAAAVRQLHRAPPRSRACAGRTRSSTRSKISLRVRNFESAHLKVNDTDGNPDRDRRRRGVAGRRHRRSDVRGGRLRELRAGAERGRAAQRWPRSYPYDAHEDAHRLAARHHGRGRRASEEARSSERLPRPASRSSRRASATWPTRRRSRPPCCSGSRPAPSSPRASGSSKGAVGMVEMALEHAVAQGHRPPRRGAQGGDGQQPAGRAVRRDAARSRS